MSEFSGSGHACGSEVAPDQPLKLHAGNLDAKVVEGSVREITWAGHEAVARIYVGVRTENWETVPGNVESLFVEQVNDESFSARVFCRHLAPGVEVIWDGVLEGGESGHLSFSITARVLETAGFNRIGLCLLHRSRLLVGSRLITRNADETRELIVPRAVAPQRVVDGIEFGMTEPFRTVRIETSSGLAFTESYDGALFEIEDERNFGDGFFKSYGPPLRDRYPIKRRAGAVIGQSTTITFEATPAVRSRSASRQKGSAANAGVAIEIAPGTGLMPPVGIDRRALGAGSSSSLREVLGETMLGHVRCDVVLDHIDWYDAVADALNVAAECGVPLECGLTVSGAQDAQLTVFAALVASSGVRLARLLIYSSLSAVPDHVLMDSAARMLGRALPGVDLFAASHGDFVELNRERPRYESRVGVAFASNSGVHLRDDEVVCEGLFGQFDAVESLRNDYAVGLAVTPITLLPLSDGSGIDSGGYSGEHMMLPIDDARLDSAKGASWIAGSIAALVMAGAASLTYANQTGGTRMRPFVHVIGAACEMRGDPLLRCSVEGDERVRAIGVARKSHLDLMVVNVAPTVTDVEFLLPGNVSTMSAHLICDEFSEPVTMAKAPRRLSRDIPIRSQRASDRLAGHAVALYKISRQSFNG